MTRIPEEERNVMEKAIYLPMVLTILNRDLAVVEKSPFKLKKPYLELIEETMRDVHADLAKAKKYMIAKKLKVLETKRDDTFTMFMFVYNGFEEHHNYFNPRIRNKVQEIMEYYFFKRHQSRKQTKKLQ
ncbi:hypothetical protein [Neobacillus terrae]|uniref:hypothetical protein n=1 Tax=Neobacillus terrae TaxID=3034837 RepID=UPI00140B1930|nr:hypothetical protein [Neobacillus terrae]NHM31726.1 hypothetical protein [Neobacillus terrae]